MSLLSVAFFRRFQRLLISAQTDFFRLNQQKRPKHDVSVGRDSAAGID
jgi:hypothetical protein